MRSGVRSVTSPSGDTEAISPLTVRFGRSERSSLTLKATMVPRFSGMSCHWEASLILRVLSPFFASAASSVSVVLIGKMWAPTIRLRLASSASSATTKDSGFASGASLYSNVRVPGLVLSKATCCFEMKLPGLRTASAPSTTSSLAPSVNSCGWEGASLTGSAAQTSAQPIATREAIRFMVRYPFFLGCREGGVIACLPADLRVAGYGLTVGGSTSISSAVTTARLLPSTKNSGMINPAPLIGVITRSKVCGSAVSRHGSETVAPL